MKEYQAIKRYPDPQSRGGALDALEDGLSAARSFAQKHDVPIYVGEFSAVRSAPDGSAARYIAESIRLFEAYGWSWSYHEFRGWHGWDAEQDESGRRSSEAPVIRLLRDAMGKPAR